MDEAFRLEALRASDLPTGFGPFVLVRVLGRGSMGRVFEATRDGTPLALKVIRPAIGAEYETFARVLAKEARLGRLLDHPSIVATSEYGEHKGVPWLALELVDGVDLGAVLESWGALHPRVALTIASQLAQALDHAHHLDDDGTPTPIVHRDLKPSNVLLARGGRARLLDFGIAKAAMITGLTTASGHTRGTPRYMSPEQTRGQVLDGRSDLFGLAVLLYEMLSGERLFQGSSLIEVMSSIVSVERTLAKPGLFDAAEAAVPGVGPVIRRGLRADPDQRFARGAEMDEALQALLAGLPEGPDLESFVRGVLDGPDEDSDSERDEWEAFDERVALSEASLDSAEALRQVSGEHQVLPSADLAVDEDSESTARSPTLSDESSLPPSLLGNAATTRPARERAEPRGRPGRGGGQDGTHPTHDRSPIYGDTERSSVPIPPSATARRGASPSPNPFAEVRSAAPAPHEEGALWWYVVGVAALVALAVLWFALTR